MPYACSTLVMHKSKLRMGTNSIYFPLHQTTSHVNQPHRKEMGCPTAIPDHAARLIRFGGLKWANVNSPQGLFTPARVHSRTVRSWNALRSHWNALSKEDLCIQGREGTWKCIKVFGTTANCHHALYRP